MKQEITLSVVFEGTIFSIEEPQSLLYQMFHHDIEGIRIRSQQELKNHPEATHFKMGFNGCGRDFGTMGLLFGSGLEIQYNAVIEVVAALLRDGKKITLNAIGMSRGGIAAMILVKKLADIDTFHLKTNLLLLDPVPGNLSWTVKLDYFNWTLNNQSQDLSHSKNLLRADAVYPYLEVGDGNDSRLDKVLAHFHIPVRPRYAPQTKVKEDVVLGAHLGAFQLGDKGETEKLVFGINVLPIIRQLSKEFIYNFLSRVNALSKTAASAPPVIARCFSEDRERWTSWLDKLSDNLMPKQRPIYSPDGSFIVAGKNTYLNRIHRELNGIFTEDTENLSIKIIPDRPQKVIQPTHLSNELLQQFIVLLLHGMTPLSKEGQKGRLLQSISRDLDNNLNLDEEQLSYSLRNIIAVILQRNRFSYSLFSTTTSGEVAVGIINDSRFLAIRHCLKPDGEPIVYADLGRYVLGRDQLSHFNSDNKSSNLEQIAALPLGADLFTKLF